MLCRHPYIWNGLKAVILDEIHLIDAGYQGDQLRILLERLLFEHITVPIQYAALSATLYDPEDMAKRYFKPVTSIRIGEPRPISIKLFYDLKKMMEFIQQNRMHKVLIFANSRRDMEHLGTKLKSFWPKDWIIIYHGSLSKQMRNTAEKALQEWR